MRRKEPTIAGGEEYLKWATDASQEVNKAK
jgi:hypothetical protein